LQDLRAFAATRQRYQLACAAGAILLPVLIVAGFYHDSFIPPPPQGPIYVESWPATRSDAEIIAEQKVDQKARDEAREARRQQFVRLKAKMERYGL
jgi:hypothetical protein